MQNCSLTGKWTKIHKGIFNINNVIHWRTIWFVVEISLYLRTCKWRYQAQIAPPKKEESYALAPKSRVLIKKSRGRTLSYTNYLIMFLSFSFLWSLEHGTCNYGHLVAFMLLLCPLKEEKLNKYNMARSCVILKVHVKNDRRILKILYS